MEQGALVEPAEVLLQLCADFNCVKGHNKVDVLLELAEEETLVEGSELPHLFHVDDGVGVHASFINVLKVESVLVVDAVNVDRRLGSLVFQEVIYHLLAKRSEARIGVDRKLESLHKIGHLQLVPYLVLHFVLEVAFDVPELAPLVEKLEVIRRDIAVRHNELIELLVHL